MRKILTTIFVLWTILLTSCFDHFEVQPPDSIYKEDILSYFEKLKSKISDDIKTQQIEELTQSIDFKKVEIYDLRTTEKAIIADINPLKEFEKTDRLKALFFVNQGEIVRSNIISISSSSRFNNPNKLILSILNMQNDRDNFSGKIAFYSPFQKLLLVNEFDNGKLISNGIARKVDHKNATGRTNGCIDWYLITTWYYSWGTRTTETYLYTTCDKGTGCEEQSYRVGRVNCGGGGSGGGSSNGPNLPTNPQHGDEYEYTDPDGKYTKYKFDSPTNTWTIVQVILPPITIQSEPENYPYLQIQWPFHGQMVFGDNLLYTYDGSTGNWLGEVTVIVEAPGDPIEDITEYLECFDKNSGAKVTILVEQPKPNSSDTWAGTVWNPRVGHTFVAIQQGGVTRVFGFYPGSGVNPMNPSASSVLVDDSGHAYHVSIEITVNASQLTNVINTAIGYTGTYNLNSYNCTDFGIGIAAAAGVTLPDTYGSWTGGGGSNPGNLGQDLRSLTPPQNTSVNTTGGTAPSNSGTCN